MTLPVFYFSRCEVRFSRYEVRGTGLLLVLLEAPEAAVATEHEFIAAEVFNLESYVVERLETIGVFYGGGVSRRGGDGVALYEETIALVLEIAIQFILAETLHPYDGAGETDVLRIGA